MHRQSDAPGAHKPTPQVRSLYERFYNEVVTIILANTSEFVGKFVGLEMNQWGTMTLALGPNLEVSWPTLLIHIGMDETFAINIMPQPMAATVTAAEMLLSGAA